MAKFTWKVWLYLNKMTKDVDNDSYAEVSTAGTTKRNEDIAQDMKDEGSDLQYETLLDVLNRGDRHRLRGLLQGYSIQTGLVHIQPRVKGSWYSEHPAYHPAEHKITADATLTDTARAALQDVTVEVLDMKHDGGAYINQVTDSATGGIDSTVTAGANVIILGNKIKVDGSDPTVGVYFYLVEDDAVVRQFTASQLTINDPKRIILTIPASWGAGGTLKLYIITQHVGSGSALLKEPRTITFDKLLTTRVPE